jgi:hypothetical protein
MLYTPTIMFTTAEAASNMPHATVHLVQAHHKENKPPGASLKHRTAFESWNLELDSAYTTTAFDAFPSHPAKTSCNMTGLQQLYSEQYARSSSSGLEQQTVARDDVQGRPVPRHSPYPFGN